MRSVHAYLLIFLAFVVAVVDGALKSIALQRLSEYESRLAFVDLTLHKNYGIAFNIPVPLWIVLPLTALIVGWLWYIAYSYWAINKPASVSAIVVIIGSLGNFIDRWMHQFTTDYLLLFQKSAINLSDLLILLGIASLLWYTRDRRN